MLDAFYLFGYAVEGIWKLITFQGITAFSGANIGFGIAAIAVIATLAVCVITKKKWYFITGYLLNGAALAVAFAISCGHTWEDVGSIGRSMEFAYVCGCFGLLLFITILLHACFACRTKK